MTKIIRLPEVVIDYSNKIESQDTKTIPLIPILKSGKSKDYLDGGQKEIDLPNWKSDQEMLSRMAKGGIEDDEFEFSNSKSGGCLQELI